MLGRQTILPWTDSLPISDDSQYWGSRALPCGSWVRFDQGTRYLRLSMETLREFQVWGRYCPWHQFSRMAVTHVGRGGWVKVGRSLWGQLMAQPREVSSKHAGAHWHLWAGASRLVTVPAVLCPSSFFVCPLCERLYSSSFLSSDGPLIPVLNLPPTHPDCSGLWMTPWTPELSSQLSPPICLPRSIHRITCHWWSWSHTQRRPLPPWTGPMPWCGESDSPQSGSWGRLTASPWTASSMRSSLRPGGLWRCVAGLQPMAEQGSGGLGRYEGQEQRTRHSVCSRDQGKALPLRDSSVPDTCTWWRFLFLPFPVISTPFSLWCAEFPRGCSTTPSGTVFQEEKEIIFWVNLCPLKEELEEETVDGF